MKVLHAPVNVGNEPWTLSRAERDIGFESDVICNYTTWVGYAADEIISSKPGSTEPSEIRRRQEVGAMAPFNYDVFHYYFGRSLLYWDDLPQLNLLPFEDLKWARKLGKRIVMTLQGCDVRLASVGNAKYPEIMCAPGRCSAYQVCISELDAQRRKLVEEILPLCDAVFYLNPDLGQYVPGGQFVPYTTLDIWKEQPISEAEAWADGVPGIDRPVRIVHGPSDPNIKGTKDILEALEQLKADYPFELTLVTGKSHSEAMQLYRGADFAIDQIRAGWYGGFAVELMAMGRPVAAHVRDSDLHVIPPLMREEMAILQLRPDHLVEDLRAILSDAPNLHQRGRTARRYVERWHDPVKMAAGMARIYRGETDRIQFGPEV